MRDLSGNLIAGALVKVGDTRKVIKSAEQGDYWRLLNPGMYQVEVSLPNAPGKVSKSVHVGTDPTRVDFVLELQDATSHTQNSQENTSSSSPGVVAIVLLSFSGVLLLVIVVMILYYRKVRKDYEYSKMEFT